ncbi:MAG TPA: polysaccharide biosynthesis C-terminal domain-containing protein [Cyclobacteriaceae bacterium]|nr:polysaccharide biosynthesis C-terminal domain-containing protein [Cyclobacteriaceae bacterium]
MTQPIISTKGDHFVLHQDTKKKSLRNLVGKGFWAVLDKGLFASSNFFMNVLLANWLSQQEYGSFSVALAIFFLVSAFHTTLLSEPMLVFGPGKYRTQLPDYLGVIFLGHCAIATLGSVVILAGALWVYFIGQNTLALSLVAMAIASPCILLQWIMRRITYVKATPHLAAYAGILYLVAMMVGISSLYTFHQLSSVSALGVMAVSSVFSVWWMIKGIQVKAALSNTILFQSCFDDHRKYGGWATGTAFLRWIPSNFYYVLLPIWGGLEASGALRALMNLLVPFQNMTLALGDVLVPMLVKVRQGKVFKSLTIKTLILSLLVSGLYWLGLAIFGETIMQWIYRGGYVEHAGLLWIIALSVVFATLASVFGIFLRAANKPDFIFRAYSYAMIVTVPFALWATASWGLRGAGLSIALGSLMTAAVMAWFYWLGVWTAGNKEAPSL